ncbi:MAG TPA: Ig-like domain-containing protein [Fluviicoccus sp.]|nr:Ig-like domain-containing protein [Fluviicoccus sp.]
MKITTSCTGNLIRLPVLMLGVLAAGCGGPDSILGESGNTAALAPAVTATAPLAAVPPVVNVALNSRLTATFSKDMDPLTIRTPALSVDCPAGTPVTGAVSYVAASRTATFTPAAPLPGNTPCTATIDKSVRDTAGLPLAAAFVWRFVTGPAPDTTPPRVTLKAPAPAETGVAVNARIIATFTEDMDPATINATTVMVQGPGASPVNGTVSYAAGARTATFTPANPATLTAGSVFTATVTTGARDLAGNALTANAGWSFTTGAARDTTAPTVIKVNPLDLSTGICLQKTVSATFSEGMDPLTLTNAAFTLKTTGGAGAGGTVTYDARNRVATLTPAADLLGNTRYTATLSTDVRDLAGNRLALNKAWSFTTGAQPCNGSVSLGAAAPFGTLGGTAGTTNTGTLTVIDGDIGTTATAASAITGFHDSANDIYTQTGSNQGAVNGRIYSCTVSTTGPTSAAVNPSACSIATQARSDAQTAFDRLAPAMMPGGVDPGAGQLGGLTLTPGIYQAAGGSFSITGADLTLDAQGDANAVWVFQTATTLTVGAAAAPRSILLINGAQPKNVFWHVGTSATINAAGGGTMVGTILASSAVSFSTVGNDGIVTLEGRAVGLNASVTMTNTVINVPAP